MTIHQNINKSGKIINVILFIVFILFALVQLNDPDAAIWFSIYGIVAFVCLMANFRRVSKIILWVLIIALVLYSLSYVNFFIEWFKIDHKEELFGKMVYEKPYLEGTREFLGLLIAVSALIYQLKRPIITK